MTKKLRVAWIADCDTSGERDQTVSSYCTQLLIPRLRERFDIELFSDRLSMQAQQVGIQHYLTAVLRHQRQPFDIFFYQLEDHRRARFARSHLGLMPGVLWAHDLYLSDLGAEAFHTSPWEKTIQKFYDPVAPFADRNRPAHQLFPLAYREVSLCPIVLCSSRRGVEALHRITGRRLTVDTKGDYLYGYLPIPVEEVEHRWQPSNEKMVRLITPVSSGIEGRAHKFLAALSTLPLQWHLSWLIDSSESQRVEALLDEFSVREQVTVVENRSVKEWQKLISKADIALHFHNGFYGHTAPFLPLSLNAGIPCLGLRGIGGRDFPEDVLWTVVPGHHEAWQVREAILTIVQRGVLDCGARGRKFVQRESAIEVVTEGLVQTFMRAVEPLSRVMSRWQGIAGEAKVALFREVQGMMDGEGEISPFSSIFAPAARELGWIDE